MICASTCALSVLSCDRAYVHRFTPHASPTASSARRTIGRTMRRRPPAGVTTGASTGVPARSSKAAEVAARSGVWVEDMEILLNGEDVLYNQIRSRHGSS